MRYEHFLYRSKPAPWPKAVACVSCDVRWEADAAILGREICVLARWYIDMVERVGTAYISTRKAMGNDAVGFWDCLQRAANRTTNLWVITTSFRVQAAALGLWERMENGTIRIAGRDSRRSYQGAGKVPDMQGEMSRDNVPSPAALDRDSMPGVPGLLYAGAGVRQIPGVRRGKKAGGVCILEDPPIVVELKIDSTGCKTTWVDAANYGVSTDDSNAADCRPAEQLARWFVGAASTLQSLGKCGWQSTAGSQAMHLFKCEYLDAQILSHTEPIATALERDGSFGGRCECFQLGRIAGPVHLFDFRSLYPYLCSTTAVPCRLANVVANPTMEQLSSLQSVGFLIADVAIQTDEPEYPKHAGNETIYPCGRFWTTLCGAELGHALSNGNVRGVRRLACYESESALAGFSEALYARRQQADSVGDVNESAWIKRMMVALPGKFAQRTAAWEDMPNAECPWEWAEWYGRSKSGEPERWRVIAGHIQREQKGGYAHGTVPAISTCITAAGRKRLLDACRCAGWEHIYYCDTDSIMCDDYASESLTIGGWVRTGEWGFLQHVVTADSADIFGVKHYRIGERIRESGRIISPDDGGGDRTCSPAQPWIAQSLRRQQPPADWREYHPFIRGPGRYDQYRQPGGRVKPPVLMEW